MDFLLREVVVVVAGVAYSRSLNSVIFNSLSYLSINKLASLEDTFETTTQSLTHPLTRVRSRATSEAKNKKHPFRYFMRTVTLKCKIDDQGEIHC